MNAMYAVGTKGALAVLELRKIFIINTFANNAHTCGIVQNKHCWKTFFVNNSHECDKQKTFPLYNVLLTMKTLKQFR